MKNILVPTDFSESAHQALRYAVMLSEKVAVKIHVLYWTEILIPTSTPQHMYREFYEKIKSEKLELLKQDSDSVLRTAALNAQAEYIIGDGSDLDTVINFAVKEYGIDVIVMGTHGASGLTKLFVGSNTAKMIEKAEVPVIAIPAGTEVKPVNKIGYASDLKDVLNEMNELVKFAGYFGAAIDIFHIYPSFPVYFEVSQENVDMLLGQLAAKYPEQKFSLHIIQTYKDNDVVNGIEKYIKGFKPDVLAMFTLKRTFFDKLFEASTTEEIAFNTNVPLLTIKKSV